MLIYLRDLVLAQAKVIENSIEAITHLLNYATTHLNSKILFRKSGMILHIHSDRSYLSDTKLCSQVKGHLYLSDKTLDSSKYKKRDNSRY